MGDMAPPSLDHTSKVITISTQVMIGSIMAIFIVVTICFFVYLYVKCCWSNNGEDRSIVSWSRQLARQRRTNSARLNRQGLDPAVLKSLHKVVYDSKDFKEGLECSVCLSEVSQGECVRLLPKCNHGFHVDCIDMWFQSHSTCPLCRNPVLCTPSTSSNDANNNSEVLDNDSFHSSISDFLDDNQRDSNSTPRVGVVVFSGASTSSSSNGVNRPRNQEMVIEIPTTSHELCEDCLASPPLEEVKTPVMARLGSLKRLWSSGKRVASPSPKASSSSSNIDLQV